MATARFAARVLRPIPPLRLKWRRLGLAIADRAEWLSGPPDLGTTRRVGRFKLVYVPDAFDQFVETEGLGQEFARAGHHGATKKIRLVLDRHHDDGGIRSAPGDPGRRRDAVDPGHIDIHQHNMGSSRKAKSMACSPLSAMPTISISGSNRNSLATLSRLSRCRLQSVLEFCRSSFCLPCC